MCTLTDELLIALTEISRNKNQKYQILSTYQILVSSYQTNSQFKAPQKAERKTIKPSRHFQTIVQRSHNKALNM